MPLREQGVPRTSESIQFWKGGDLPYLIESRPKVTIRWVGKATWIQFPPRALPIEKEMKLKTTEIGSLTEMVRPHYVFLVSNERPTNYDQGQFPSRKNGETNVRRLVVSQRKMYERASNKSLRMSNCFIRISIVLFIFLFIYFTTLHCLHWLHWESIAIWFLWNSNRYFWGSLSTSSLVAWAFGVSL